MPDSRDGVKLRLDKNSAARNWYASEFALIRRWQLCREGEGCFASLAMTAGTDVWVLRGLLRCARNRGSVLSDDVSVLPTFHLSWVLPGTVIKNCERSEAIFHCKSGDASVIASGAKQSSGIAMFSPSGTR
jgi:hypothetical protein